MKLTHDFEHQIWKVLKDHGLEKAESYLLAISGGLDSMVLLEVMSIVRPQARLRIAHFHHGLFGEQAEYRDQVAKLVRARVAEIQNAEFIFSKSDLELKSEDEMRKSRWSFLRKEVMANEPILTAHHQDDWVETVTLKLIRGTSEQGLLAFQVWNHEIFRPFLQKNKSELLDYAEARKLKWVEDPSNSSTDYLRNWLRETWFQDLEKKSPGAYHNFSKSLQHLADELASESVFKLQFHLENTAYGLDRAWYLGLSDKDQLKALALYLKTHNVYEFTRGQLEEIKKRLDKNQNDITFEIVKKWVINATQIMLE